MSLGRVRGGCVKVPQVTVIREGRPLYISHAFITSTLKGTPQSGGAVTIIETLQVEAARKEPPLSEGRVR